MKALPAILFWLLFSGGLFYLALRRARSREDYWKDRDDVDFDDWKVGDPNAPVQEDAKPTEFR